LETGWALVFLPVFSQTENPSCGRKLRPAAKKRFPAAGFPILLHDGASLSMIFPFLPIAEPSLWMEIVALLSREAKTSGRAAVFSTGQVSCQQDTKNPGRTGELPVRRVKMRQGLIKKVRFLAT
jgi:hypothetical protein